LLPLIPETNGVKNKPPIVCSRIVEVEVTAHFTYGEVELQSPVDASIISSDGFRTINISLLRGRALWKMSRIKA
jgi:hypothetical protein